MIAEVIDKESVTIRLSHASFQRFCRQRYSSDCDIHFYVLESQGSVATYFRCGGMFKYVFVENLPLSLSVKEL